MFYKHLLCIHFQTTIISKEAWKLTGHMIQHDTTQHGDTPIFENVGHKTSTTRYVLEIFNIYIKRSNLKYFNFLLIVKNNDLKL